MKRAAAEAGGQRRISKRRLGRAKSPGCKLTTLLTGQSLARLQMLFVGRAARLDLLTDLDLLFDTCSQPTFPSEH